VSPTLAVKLDGDSSALPFVPDSLVDPHVFVVGDRVRCELTDSRRLVVHGISGGAAAVPGVIQMFAASAPPPGWLICDGSAVSRTTYAALFAVIGTTYGAGNGTTTFNLPNLASRVPAGWNTTDTDFNTLGKTGGEKTHTLVASEIPDFVAPNNQGGFLSTPTQSGSTYGFYYKNTGGAAAHNNLQPYLTVNFIVKY
jgi:microcystin-dependent protein